MDNYCGNCGNKLEEGAIMCPKCNKRLDNKFDGNEVKTEEYKRREKIHLSIIIIFIVFYLELYFFQQNDYVILIKNLVLLAGIAFLVYTRFVLSKSRLLVYLFNFLMVILFLMFVSYT